MITTTTYGKLPAIRIAAPDGAQATVTLYGAHLVSWKSADGKERLFMSSASALDGSRAIRGGVPVIFPQFAERGAGLRHGFARTSTWRHIGDGVSAGATYADFELGDEDLSAQAAASFPRIFRLRLRVSIWAQQLQLSLDVTNQGDDMLQFAAALHTYYLLQPGETARIAGLEAAPFEVNQKIDRIYRHIGAPIALNGMRLEQQGFRDAVVWNPGAEDAAALPDMADDEYQRFVCIEPAAVDPMPLYPGETWTGRSIVTATD
ncbi:MAG TPA: D-hexose-6-phosphate mutarotase [Telluria sp.]|nr:D-hexose-6-phosphate mutarotase [Telluria sp.]